MDVNKLNLQDPISSSGLRVIHYPTKALDRSLCYNSGNQGKRRKAAPPKETVAEACARRSKPEVV